METKDFRYSTCQMLSTGTVTFSEDTNGKEIIITHSCNPEEGYNELHLFEGCGNKFKLVSSKAIAESADAEAWALDWADDLYGAFADGVG